MKITKEVNVDKTLPLDVLQKGSSLEDAAYLALKELKFLLMRDMEKIGTTESECLKKFFTRSDKKSKTETRKLSEIDMLGLQLVCLLIGESFLKKGGYDTFFRCFMIASGLKNPTESEIRSAIGKENAFKRHIETYEIKEQVLSYWNKNIDPKLSNEKAATLLLKANIAPISFRKLTQYVAEAKKMARIENTSS